MTTVDHATILAAVAEVRAEGRAFKEEILRRLDAQDEARAEIKHDVEILKTAHNIAVGKGLAAKLGLTTVAGGLGAAIVKVVELLSNHNPPPMPGPP